MNGLGFIVLWVLPILAAMLLIAVALWLLDKSRESPFPDF
jgi:cytochrome c-type biogenesis protein CcmH/NrfF